MIRRNLRAALLALTLIAIPTAGASAAPGDLDPTFGDSGVAVVDLDGSEEAVAIAQRPDGRIVLGGTQSGGAGVSPDGIVAQLGADSGKLDPAYGLGSGWTRIDRGAADSVTDLALQPDGRIVAVGNSAGNGFAARLLAAEGTLDPSFGGGDGFAGLPLGGNDTVKGLALQPDGRVVVAGYTESGGTTDGIFARLLEPQGTFDDSFADIGVVSEDFGSPTLFVNDVALQPDGRIVYTGSISIGGGFDIIVGRLLNPEGDGDPSFGGGTGRTVIDLGGSDFAQSVAIQPDGRIVVAGGGGNNDVAVARLLPNGLPDPAFAGDGSTTVDFGSEEFASGLVVQPDGKVLVVGITEPGPTGRSDMAVARLLTNGTPDPGFGNGGRARVDLGAFEEGLAIALRPDGRVVVAGTTRPTDGGSRDIAVVRLQGGDPPPGPGGPGGPGGAAGLTAVCAGRQATIVGTSGRDRLRGTAKADVIAALGGNDVISGLGGNDVVCGGAGNDQVDGGAGADRLIGGAGADRLAGGAGADRVEGGAGADRLLGGAGRDRLLGGAGADRLVGGGGVDALLGGAGRNVRTQ